MVSVPHGSKSPSLKADRCWRVLVGCGAGGSSLLAAQMWTAKVLGDSDLKPTCRLRERDLGGWVPGRLPRSAGPPVRTFGNECILAEKEETFAQERSWFMSCLDVFLKLQPNVRHGCVLI